jgi:hypothetical protein
VPRFSRRSSALAVVALAGVSVLALGGPALAALPAVDETQLVSVNTSGVASGAFVSNGAVSANGRYVVFASTAQDLVTVPASTGGQYDVFRRDLLTGETVLVSFDSTGLAAANAGSGGAAISADGRYVVFSSTATNISPLDTSTTDDIFIRDMDLGTTTLVSVNVAGTASGDDYSTNPSISGDGTIVSFTSRAADLVATDTNGVADVFYRTIAAATPVTTLVSLRVTGDQTDSDSGYAASPLSFDGTFIAYDSLDTGIFPSGTTGYQIYRKDLSTNTTRSVSYGLLGSNAPSAYYPSISADGSLVAFSSDATNMYEDDTNGVEDVFVRSLSDNSLTVVSVQGSGGAAGDSTRPFISADGRFVAFESDATYLTDDAVTGNGDIYVSSLAAGTTRLVSRNLDETGGASDRSYGVTLSSDGSVAAFASDAVDLTANDTNGAADMFARGLAVPAVVDPADPADPTLAATGFDATGIAMLAAAFLVAGALLVRRRAA